MAGSRRDIGSAEYGSDVRRKNQNMGVYVDGTAVRRLEPAPEAYPQKERRQRKISEETRQNRERARRMDRRYVGFLSASAVAVVVSCAVMLRFQAVNTRLQKQVTALEVSLDSAVLENNSNYNRIMANVDMEHVKDVAMNELGMGYVSQSQIQTYDVDSTDYVRQYSEIPEN